MPSKSVSRQVIIGDEQLNAAAIPDRFKRLDITRYKGAPRSVTLLKRFTSTLAKNRKSGLGLTLRGAHESGKTLLACYVLICAMADSSKKWTCLFTNLFDVTDQLTRKDRRLVDFAKIDFLVLDNLSEEISAFERKVLQQLLSMRKDYAAPTILVTPLTKEVFGSVYGSSVEAYCASYTHTIDLSVPAKDIEAEVEKRKQPVYDKE